MRFHYEKKQEKIISAPKLIIILSCFVCLFSLKSFPVKAGENSSCLKVSLPPYSGYFEDFVSYMFEDGVAAYQLDNCDFAIARNKSIYIYKGYIGSATIVMSHVLGAGCDDGVCDWNENEEWSSPSVGDLFFAVVFDTINAEAYMDYFENGIIPTPPGDFLDDFDYFYWWYGSFGYRSPDQSETPSPFTDNFAVNKLFEIISGVQNLPPFSYMFDIASAWNSEENLYASPQYGVSFSSVGLTATASLNFNDESSGIGLKENWQGLFDLACWATTGFALYFRITYFFGK